MASANTLCKHLLGVKSAVVTGHNFYQDSNGVNHLWIHARPDKRHENDCPFCHKRCRLYDVQTRLPRTWRDPDWGGTLVEIQYRTHRILCPEHGVLVADVPWAYPESGFTKDFDLTVGWLAVYLPRSAVSEYMRIDWETVGRCAHRTLNEIEPERSRALITLSTSVLTRPATEKVTSTSPLLSITIPIPSSGRPRDTARRLWNSFLPPADTRAVGQHTGRYWGRCQMDHGLRQRVHSFLRTLRRSLPRRRVGDGGAGCGSPRGMEGSPH